MPTENKSKRLTAAAIKIEPQPLYPISHYVDDPVALIREVFSSLKSKTIKSIAPDFLQVITFKTHFFCIPIPIT